MTDSNNSRRKLLKAIAAGSGAVVAGKTMPETWSRPVVDSVVLPAHAQTSVIMYSGANLPGQSVLISSLETDNLFAEMVDTLTPEAHAGNPGDGGTGYYACAMPSGSMVSVTVAGQDSEWSGASMIRRGTLDMNGAQGSITASGADVSNCGDFGPNSLTRPAWINPTLTNNSQIAIEILTRCGEAEGNSCSTPILRIIVPRNDSGCLPEPPVASCIELQL